MADYITEAAPEQGRDTFGLVAGLIFALVGVAFLIGGHDAFTKHWNLVLPGILVLLGAVGLAASGVLRRPRRNQAAPDDPDAPIDLENSSVAQPGLD